MKENLSREEIAKIDRADMLGRVLSMPQHFVEARQRAQAVPLELNVRQIQNIVVAGMGGSAISGELAKSLTYNQLPAPLAVCRSYTLPNFVDRHTLVIVSSYSGNTEETLALFEQARRREAQIVCITSGGEVGSIARTKGLPIFSPPSGFPPRAALVHLLLPLLKTLHAGRLIADPETDIDETVALLQQLGERYQPDTDEPGNTAKHIARALRERVPLIYAAEIYETVAWRWKEQFCENSEILAWHNVFPELNHNELVGWGRRGEMDQRFQVIYLHDGKTASSEIHPRVRARMELTRRLIERTGPPIIEAASQGQSLLARFFSLIFLGDMVSVYLAVLNGVDPTLVEKIDYLKNQMAKV